jgi:hypothetical protein
VRESCTNVDHLQDRARLEIHIAPLELLPDLLDRSLEEGIELRLRLGGVGSDALSLERKGNERGRCERERKED